MKAKLWTELDVIILIAWLDFSLWKGLNFETTIIEQLKKSRKEHTGHEFEFSILQVRNKLIELGRKDTEQSSGMPYPRLQEIFSRGSICFPGLSRELRQLVEEAIELFRTSYTLSQQIVEGQPDQSTEAQKPSEAGPDEDLASNDRLAQEVEAGARIHSSETASGSAQSSAIQSTVSSRPLTPNEQWCSEISTNFIPPSRSRKTIDIRKGYSPHVGDQQRSEALEIGNDEAKLQNIREADVATLYERIADLEKDKERLLAMLGISENARKLCKSDSKDPKELQFRLYQEQLWDLQQRNMRLEMTADFFRLSPTQSRPLRVEVVENSMDKIRSVLESILGGCDTNILRLNTAIEPGSDLEALVLSSMDLHKTPEQLKARLNECISQVEVPVILRSLVLAALQDWVFNTSFPSFMSEGASSLLLKSMEEIIMDYRDWALLRNLETAAYSRLLERSEFKEGLLPWTSRLLAERLRSATAAFLIPASLGNGPSDVRVALESVLKTLHCRFIQLFSAGLEFKAATGATDNRYEFLLNPPETITVENGRKQPATKRTSKIRKLTQRRHLVNSWFHASLKVYDAAPPNWLNPRADAIIQTNNFVPGISKTKCHCIHSSEIIIEMTDSTPGNINLQSHSHFGTTAPSQREPFPLMVSTNELFNAGSSNFGKTGDTPQQTGSRLSQTISTTSTNNKRCQTQPESIVEMRMSQTHSRLNKDNCSLIDRVPVESPLELSVNLLRANRGTMRSERADFDQGADSTHKHEGPWICLACGTTLSSNDALKKHEINESCRRCIICERVFRSNSSLKKHQKAEHPIKKRLRPSSDQFSTKRVNPQKPDADKNNSCEKCGYEPNNRSNLQRHKINKSCSKCLKCREYFDGPNELHSHMEIIHGLQLTDRSRQVDLGERGGKQHESSDMPERSSTTTSEKCNFNDDREARETRVSPHLISKHAQGNGAANIDSNSKKIQNVDNSRISFKEVPMKQKSYCSICKESFLSAYSLQRHQHRQCHLNRVRETEKRSAPHRQGSVPTRPKNRTAKATKEGGVSKSRVEKPRRSRASTKMRREPTPESRHVARIIAKLAEVEGSLSAARSSPVSQQQATSIAPSVSHTNDSIK